MPMQTSGMSSQFGQSEWIYEFLCSLGQRNGTVFESGAATPNRISNSKIFLDNGYNALLCEANPKHSREWKELKHPNVRLLDQPIQYHPLGLENALIELDSPKNLEVLFLDIDGGEYHLLKGLRSFRPKLICVEYDNAYPLSIEYIPKQIRHGFAQASSIAMFRMMKEKGYQFLMSFFHDLIFISEEYLQANSITISRLRVPWGDDLYYSTATSNLYQLDSVLKGDDNSNGGEGIEFYAVKLRNLIDNDEISSAKSFYAHLLCSFYSLRRSVQYRGDSYVKEFDEAAKKFEYCFRWLLKFR